MDETLLNCPFCGGEAHVLSEKTHNGGRRFRVGCYDPCCSGAAFEGAVFFDKSDAITAWNRRAERTCHVETTERRVSQTQTLVTKSCSACGYAFGDEEVRPILPGLDETMALDPVHVPSYCPHCGARVVEVSE